MGQRRAERRRVYPAASVYINPAGCADLCSEDRRSAVRSEGGFISPRACMKKHRMLFFHYQRKASEGVLEQVLFLVMLNRVKHLKCLRRECFYCVCNEAGSIPYNIQEVINA
jgi:hypothetical protein